MSTGVWTLTMRGRNGSATTWGLASVGETIAAATVVGLFWPDLHLTARRTGGPDAPDLAGTGSPDRTAATPTEVR